MSGALLASTALTRDLPDVFLPYQQELWRELDLHQVVVEEKSRRTGFSWAAGAIAAERASLARGQGGSDVLYMGYEREMTREFIDYVAMWAKEFQAAASAVEEFVFTDPDNPDKSVGAFRIRFASGYEVIALPSVARALRGKQGLVILDEAAFMDDLEEVLKAAFALLIWGGKVLIISTHNGDTNPFNKLVSDIRAGRKPGYKLLRTTFDEALSQGLYRRICLTQGKAWSVEAEAAWRQEIVVIYGDNADEELHVIPSPSTGVYLSGVLLEARAVEEDVVLRWTAPPGFDRLDETARRREVERWIGDELRPRLARLDKSEPHVLGEDFGRIRDLTVMWVLAICRDLVRRTRLVLELRQMPFRQQEQVLFALCDALPKFRKAIMDAGGNGMFLAEVAVTRYGASRIEGLQLTEPWYREQMPTVKAAIEDAMMTLPADRDVIDDWRMLRLVRGVARVPDRRRDDAGQPRHGDAAIAGSLAYVASHADTEIIGYTPVPVARSMFDLPRAETWLGPPPTPRAIRGQPAPAAVAMTEVPDAA